MHNVWLKKCLSDLTLLAVTKEAPKTSTQARVVSEVVEYYWKKCHLLSRLFSTAKE